MKETEIPGETQLDVQYRDVSNTINSVKEELSCDRSSSLVIAQAKLLSCMSSLNGSELRA